MSCALPWSQRGNSLSSTMPRDANRAVIRTVEAALERAQVAPDSLILAGVSGGADSVAMLLALVELAPRMRYRLAAAHLNHRIRASESDRDEEFVRDLCARLGVALEVGHAAGLSAGMPNLEEAAREARHDFLRSAAKRLGAAWIALAHTAGDQAETVLMRLVRGAGITGLAAMSESGPGGIVRPMLTLERGTIEQFLRASGQQWIEDSSNTSDAMLRNRVRRELLPYLEREYAPGLSRRLAGLAAEMRAVDEFLSRAAMRELSRVRRDDGAIDLAEFAGIDPALKPVVIRLFLAEQLGDLRRVGRVQIDATVRLATSGPPNGSIALPRGMHAVRDYARLRVATGGSEVARPFSVPIAFDGETDVPAAGRRFVASVIAREAAGMPADLMTALFDVRELMGRPLAARSFRPGDRITPLGMTNSRKVKEVFIDRKVPRAERAKFPIVATDGEVLWLPGLARSAAARVTDWTETVLRIEARQLQPRKRLSLRGN